MSLAQLSDCKQAIQLYQTGIEIYKTQYNEFSGNTEIKSSIAKGYAALAELYMNSDLW